MPPEEFGDARRVHLIEEPLSEYLRYELVALEAVRDLVWSRSWSLAEQLARKSV